MLPAIYPAELANPTYVVSVIHKLTTHLLRLYYCQLEDVMYIGNNVCKSVATVIHKLTTHLLRLYY